MTDDAETAFMVLDGGSPPDRLIVFARATAIAWSLAGATSALVRLTALPVDPAVQMAELREAGFEIEPVRRWMRFIHNDLQARARVSTPAQLERMLPVVDRGGELALRVTVQFEARGAERSRIEFFDHESIALSADDGALRERLMRALLVQLAPFATTKRITVELVATEST